jgi:hypothetical protein
MWSSAVWNSTPTRCRLSFLYSQVALTICRTLIRQLYIYIHIYIWLSLFLESEKKSVNKWPCFLNNHTAPCYAMRTIRCVADIISGGTSTTVTIMLENVFVTINEEEVERIRERERELVYFMNLYFWAHFTLRFHIPLKWIKLHSQVTSYNIMMHDKNRFSFHTWNEDE